MKVIQGQGTPRFIVEDQIISLDDAKFSYNVSNRLVLSNITVLNGGVDTAVNLNLLDSDRAMGNIINKQVILYNSVSNAILAYGKLTSYTQTSLTVDDWDVPVISLSDPVIDVNSRLRIINRVIDLPYCEQLKEYFRPETLEHDLYKGETVVRIKGFWYRAQLGYDSYASKELVASLQSIFDINRANMYFYPRKDNANVCYKADLEKNTELTLAQLRNHAGHKYVNISVRGLQRLKKVLLDLPDPEGYGDAYGGTMTAGYGETL